MTQADQIAKLDELIEELRRLLAPGEPMVSVSWHSGGNVMSVPVETMAKLAALEVLDKLAEKAPSWMIHYSFSMKCLNITRYDTTATSARGKQYSPSFDYPGEFPQAVLAACDSDEYATWRKEQG